MTLSIKKQILSLFLLVVILSLTLLSFMTRTTVDNCFHDYKWEEKSRMFNHIIESLEDYYAKHKSWDAFNGNALGKMAMQEGCYWTLYDNNNKLIWTSEHAIGLYNDDFPHRYWRNIFPVNYNNQMQGKVYIGQFMDNVYSVRDINFKDSIFYAIVMSLAASLIISLPFMMILSSRISSPIKYLQVKAENMINGDLTSEIKVATPTSEIMKLSDALNRLRISLYEQENLRKQLASNISHELRTPINVMQNQLEAILDGVLEASPDRLESLLSEIKRLTNLVGELETITEAESDSFIPDIQDVDLEEAVLSAASSFEGMFRRKNIELKTDLGKNITVKAQKDKLLQIIINIISNALKFTDSGYVSLKTYMENGRAVFEAEDTGTGIPESDITKIFERFYRVEKSRNRNTGGAGLGLSIVKSIADAHGWRVSVQSDGKSGSIFKIEF